MIMSATLTAAAEPAIRPDTDTYHLLGNLLRFVIRTHETGGAYSLTETLVAPGAGAPPNRHPADAEAFYVIDGQFEFVVEGRTISATAGDCVRVPDGAVHAFRNAGASPARLLIINSPGRDHEAFFSEAGDPLPRGTRELPPPSGAPDIPRLLEIGRRHGLEFILPPNGGH
jgi:mannose-6-phosphate isomerase-like protein (cupin superfamily)